MATSVIDGARDAITAGAIGGKGKGKIRPPPPPKAKAKPKAEGYTSQPQALQTCLLQPSCRLLARKLPCRACMTSNRRCLPCQSLQLTRCSRMKGIEPFFCFKKSRPSVHQALVRIAKLQCDDGSWRLSDELATAPLGRIASTLLHCWCSAYSSCSTGWDCIPLHWLCRQHRQLPFRVGTAWSLHPRPDRQECSIAFLH